MQVTTQAAAFFLARRHEIDAGTLQLIGQALEVSGKTHRMHSNTCLPGKITEQAAVGGRKGFSGAAWREQQLANRLVLVNEREVEEARVEAPTPSPSPVAYRDRRGG